MFDKWYESAEALFNLYKKLMELTIMNKDKTDEYSLVISLLETAIKFENDKIDKIDFNDENLGKLYGLILEHISVENSLNITDILNKEEVLVYTRMLNIAEDIDYNKRNSKAENMPKTSLNEIIASLIIETDERETKFNHAFQSYVGFNIIYIINQAIESIKDPETKEFLIRLLFSSIYINPIYEEYFKKSKSISKPINIKIYMAELINKNYSRDSLMDDIMYNITDFTVEEIMMEINKKDINLLNKDKYHEYIRNLTNIMGKLISLLDESVIDTVEEKVKAIIDSSDRTDNTRIVNEIMYMFDEARKIIKKCTKERGLKYGKTTKETN